MNLFFRIATLDDVPEIQEFEKKKLQEVVTDEMEREIQSWNAKWRPESLEHYLPNGWSFVARNPEVESQHSSEGLLMGYFLAQPLLFLDGQTQSLWVEHIAYNSLKARDEICDLAYRLSREKHLQRVYFPNNPNIQNAITNLKPQPWSATAVYVQTTKV